MVRPEIPQDDDSVETPTTPTVTPPVVVPPAPPSALAVVGGLYDINNLNSPLRWKHRRRLAYMSMLSILAVTFYIMGPWMPIERVSVLGDVISWFYFTMASIVGTYMGLATYSSKLTSR